MKVPSPGSGVANVHSPFGTIDLQGQERLSTDNQFIVAVWKLGSLVGNANAAKLTTTKRSFSGLAYEGLSFRRIQSIPDSVASTSMLFCYSKPSVSIVWFCYVILSTFPRFSFLLLFFLVSYHSHTQPTSSGCKQSDLPQS